MVFFVDKIKHLVNNIYLFFIFIITSMNKIFFNSWNNVFKRNLFLFFFKKFTTSNKNIYRIHFFNNLPNNNFFCNIFSYKLFKNFNVSNYILNNNTFFLFLINKRMDYNIKNTYFLKNSLKFNNEESKKSMHTKFLIGFRSMWLMVRNWILSLFLFNFSLFYLSFLKLSLFNIFLFKLLVLFGIFYWLFSGFTFFLKKYQYRYFTSSIQRFWKRCYSIFWMLEFFLFFIYFYLTFMSSQEPFLMYDNSQIFKTHFFSWKLFFLKIMPSIILIILTYYLTLSIKWTTYSKLDNLVLIITALLCYLFWLEFYQFFHIISFYGNYIWKISDDLSYWYLENEFKRTRINNHFISICLIAKFWHIVFTLIFWLFFVVRGLEVNRIRHPLLAANYQNFIFIYILSWLYMFPWVKYIFLKLFNTPYYWFYISNKRQILYIFFYDFYFVLTKLIFDVLVLPAKVISTTTNFYKIFSTDFFYYNSSSHTTSFFQFKKNFIKDYILKNLIN